MSTIQIADKTTLDNTKTNTTNLLTKGGIKYNSTIQKYQAYNTSTNAWVDITFGGGGSPTLIVKNNFNMFDNKNVTIANSTYGFTSTKAMGASDYITFEVPYSGDYTVTCDSTTKVATVEGVGGVVVDLFSIPAFAEATDADLDIILNAHYNDLIDISDYWAVGDKRTVSLSAMSATGVGESHAAQDVEMVIIDFDHDDLVTPINGHTKAAITLNQVNGLYNRGYMNSSNTNSGSWNNSARRTWCNNVYYNALPSGFKSLVKQVNKITAATYNGSTNQTTADYCWLLAGKEVFGTEYSSGTSYGGGYSNYYEAQALTQYPYFSTTANRIKQSSGAAYYWWERSPRYSSSSGFCNVVSDGSASVSGASYADGLAPTCCL